MRSIYNFVFIIFFIFLSFKVFADQNDPRLNHLFEKLNKTDDQKNRSLIAATRWIDTFVFQGDRCDENQALKFPRTNYQVDRVELSCSTIPNNIKYAQYELARALANDTDAITGTTGKDGNFSEVKLGDLQVKYNTESQGTGSVNNIMDVYPWLQSYLGAYMLGGAGTFQMRVVRG